MAHQRYCFALKHGLRTTPLESSSSIASATRTLTCYRESKLQDIGFLFTVECDGGANQGKWMANFHKLEAFQTQNGHFNFSASADKKLYDWILTQKRNLVNESNLTSTKQKRWKMLLALGFQL